MTTSCEWMVCPYCGYRHGDVGESHAASSPDLWHEFTCSCCQKTFEVLVWYTTTIETRRPLPPGGISEWSDSIL